MQQTAAEVFCFARGDDMGKIYVSKEIFSGGVVYGQRTFVHADRSKSIPAIRYFKNGKDQEPA